MSIEPTRRARPARAPGPTDAAASARAGTLFVDDGGEGDPPVLFLQRRAPPRLLAPVSRSGRTAG